MTRYTDFTKLENGNLRISLLPQAREEVTEIAQNQHLDADGKLAEVLEYQLSNGWSWVNPEDIAALTEAPIISEEVDYHDERSVTEVGVVYYYGAYQVLDPVEQLLENGYIDFERASELEAGPSDH